MDITFLHPGSTQGSGKDVVFEDQPLSGDILWPGADPGPPPQWPGWTQLPDGTYVEGGNFAWTRPSVLVRFDVNPSFTRRIFYPPASAVCANPPGSPDQQSPPPPGTALTGGNLVWPTAIGGTLLLVGLVASAIARRRTKEV